MCFMQASTIVNSQKILVHSINLGVHGAEAQTLLAVIIGGGSKHILPPLSKYLGGGGHPLFLHPY